MPVEVTAPYPPSGHTPIYGAVATPGICAFVRVAVAATVIADEPPNPAGSDGHSVDTLVGMPPEDRKSTRLNSSHLA